LRRDGALIVPVAGALREAHCPWPGLEEFLEAVRVELRRPPVPVRLRTYSVEELESRIRSEKAHVRRR